MIFKDALYKVLDDIMPKEDEKENVVSPQTVKILSILWNMIAVSKNVLDDLVHIDKNNTIISIPLQKSSAKTAAKKQKAVEKIEGANDTTEPTESN